MSAIPNARDLYRALRGLGFRQEYDTRGGGSRTVAWSKSCGDRKIDLQLNDDGRHRVSHYLKGRMTTPPTQFAGVDSMVVAIARELTRADHAPPFPSLDLRLAR